MAASGGDAFFIEFHHPWVYNKASEIKIQNSQFDF